MKAHRWVERVVDDMLLMLARKDHGIEESLVI
jgi:hypothetical protein